MSAGAERGEVNGYRCDRCGRHTYVVHVDGGVTPMFLACRADGEPPACGTGTSLMYPRPPIPAHIRAAVAFEWYSPGASELKRLRRRARQRGDDGTVEHVELGGLLLRPLTDAGRQALEDGAA